MDPDTTYLRNVRFGLGDSIVEGWRFFRKHFWINSLFGWVSTLPVILYSTFFTSSSITPASFSADPGAATAALAMVCGGSLLQLLASLLLGALGYSGLAYITSKTASGEPVSLGAALRHGFSRLGSALSAMILQSLIIMLLLMLLVVPGVIYAVQASFGVIAASLRGVGGKAALDYSRRTVKKRWWKVFGLYIVMYALSFGFTFLIQAGLQDSLKPLFLVLELVVMGIFTSLFAVTQTVLFLNLDIQDVGVTPPVHAPARPALNIPIYPVQPIPAESFPGGAAGFVYPPLDGGGVPEAAANPTALTTIEGSPEYAPEPEPTADPQPGAALEPAPEKAALPEPLAVQIPVLRSNDASAAFALAVLAVFTAGAGFLSPSSVIAVVGAAGFLVPVIFILAVRALKHAGRLEGRGRRPAWGSLGVSLVAAALSVILIIAPPAQTFEAGGLRLTYPGAWQKVAINTLSVCQKSNCVLTLVQKTRESQLILISYPNSARDLTIQQLDQSTWLSLQNNGTVNSISDEFTTVDGYPASRRVFTMEQDGTLAYIVHGLILTESTLYEYTGYSQNAGAYQHYAPEIDSMIQSIKLSIPQIKY